MMKTLKNLMLVGLVAVSGIINASGVPAPAPAVVGAAPAPVADSANNSDSDITLKKVAIGAAVGLGTWLAKDLYDWCKGHLNGESSRNTVEKEIDLEGKKISLALSESKSLTDQYQALVLLYNGGNNTGLDKKEIQAEIKKVWEAMKTNSLESAIIIKAAKDKIRELEQKRDGIKTAAPQTLAQATQMPVQTRQATPELAAKMLAASPARAA